MIQVLIAELEARYSNALRFYCDTKEEAKEVQKWCRVQLKFPYDEVEIYKTTDYRNFYSPRGTSIVADQWWIYTVLTSNPHNLMLAKLAYEVKQ